MSGYKKGSLAARVDADLRREQAIRRDAERKKEKEKQHTCFLCGGLALNEDFKLRPGRYICAKCHDRIFIQGKEVYNDPNQIQNGNK